MFNKIFNNINKLKLNKVYLIALFQQKIVLVIFLIKYTLNNLQLKKHLLNNNNNKQHFINH